MEFGEYLRKLRKEKNISQRELADKVGVSFPYISKIENSHIMTAPSEEILLKFAMYLDVNSDTIITIAGKIPSDIMEFITNNNEIVKFLREAKNRNLTASQWRKLKDTLDKL